MNVRTLCLAILYFADATGYEIRKKAQEGVFSYFIEASYGAIYPALQKLTEEGLVSWREEVQSGKPNKKIYALTPQGREAFIAALAGQPAEDKFKSEFLLIMMCSELVEPEQITRIIDQKLIWLDDKVAYLKEIFADCGEDGSRFAIGCGISAYESSARHLRTNRHLVENSAGTKLNIVTEI